MSACKFSVCLLLIAILNISPSTSSGSKVAIRNSNGMSGIMNQEAVDVLKNAVNSDGTNEPCEVLADYFQEKYPDYYWHSVDFNAYNIRTIKSISLAVNDNKYYLLFATNK